MTKQTTEKHPGFVFDAHGKPEIGLSDEALYAFGHFVRSTEELILDLFSRGLLSGTTHTCLGQEICQMAVVRALSNPDDVVLSNHRNHGHFLSYSGNALGLIAEIMGRQDGVCGGYGGSQHIAYRNFHSNGVQAGMTGIGCGMALDMQRSGSKGVVAIMVGDGTLGEGMLYESMNLAAVWKTAVLYVVENNGIAQTTNTKDTVKGSIEGRGAAFGLRTWRLDDSADDFAHSVDQVVQQMRDGGGPGMLVIDTCRLGPHSKGDDLREDHEKQSIAQRDPLSALGRKLDDATRSRIERANRDFLEATEAIALASPESRFDPAPTHALRATTPAIVSDQPAQAQSVRVALNAALRTLLAESGDVIVLGEDLHDPYGGAFKVTAGLSSEFPGRVISTPISEAGITGAGIGLAMAGRRPVVEIMFADFLTLCMDQLYNHAVKFPGMFPDCEVPLVVRTPCGGRRGYGPTHSQSPENLLISVPGLTVVYGSHRHNVGQLLVDAVTRWPNPVVFLEHKLLYGEAQTALDYQVVAPSTQDHGADLFPTVRRGASAPDVTLVTYGGMLPHVERAANRLEAEEEISVEVVAPSLLAPLPRDTLVPLLMTRPRIIIVEESHHEFGFSAELMATLAEAGFSGTMARLGLPPIPIASARSLEKDQLLDDQTIVDKATSLF
ncbi:thiamine pyrophosphate-dependent enzyme [Comamonadaceae bacterium G21597-S1]|nr:thiamine pyrophosphate-dependent enzyme [Comamonadaceae bacterium G21597-S1]